MDFLDQISAMVRNVAHQRSEGKAYGAFAEILLGLLVRHLGGFNG